jgi:hypothetical protein
VVAKGPSFISLSYFLFSFVRLLTGSKHIGIGDRAIFQQRFTLAEPISLDERNLVFPTEANGLFLGDYVGLASDGFDFLTFFQQSSVDNMR